MKAGIEKIAEGNLTSGCGGGRKVKRAVIVIPPTEAEEQTRMHPHTNEGLEGASGTHPFLDKALHHRRPVTTTATETPSFRKMRPAMKYRTCPRRGQSRIRKCPHIPCHYVGKKKKANPLRFIFASRANLGLIGLLGPDSFRTH